MSDLEEALAAEEHWRDRYYAAYEEVQHLRSMISNPTHDLPIAIVPVPGEQHEGRQWGFQIEVDGVPSWHVTTGGTGDCWNIDAGGDALHICDLAETIEQLIALRDSEANRKHRARWAVA